MQLSKIAIAALQLWCNTKCHFKRCDDGLTSVAVQFNATTTDASSRECSCVCIPKGEKKPVAQPGTNGTIPIPTPTTIIPLPTMTPLPNGDYRYVAYHIAWGTYARNFQPSDIPMDKITHLNYAFANVDSEGQVTLGDSYADVEKAFPGDSWEEGKQPYRGQFWQLKKLKEKNPHVKLMISIGGWTWSGSFSDIASTSEGREKFAQSCVDFITKYDFDGVDIDWEYPVEGGLETNKRRKEDGENYTLLLQAVRNALGPNRLLSIAAPAGPSMKHLEVQKIGQIMDFMNIMTYDFRGGWSKSTGHHAPLHTSSKDPEGATMGDIAGTVQFYTSNGFPAKKINLGVGFYGRGWGNVQNVNHGLFQPFNGVPKGSWEEAIFDYKDIKKKIAEKKYQRYYDEEAKVPFVYSKDDKIMISYDDAQSIEEKCNFIKSQGLGGIMAWELTGDDQHELTRVISSNLKLALAPSSISKANHPDGDMLSSNGSSNKLSFQTMLEF